MPNYYNPYQYMYQNPQMQQPIQPQNTGSQLQNGGFMLVPSEETVKNYPVALGTSMTFKIEGQPIIMEKSMGFSQLEAPKIDKYRLVRDDTLERAETPQNGNIPPQLGEISKKEFKCEIDKIWCEIQALKDAKKRQTGARKKEVEDDD